MFNINPQRTPHARPSVRDYVSDRVFDGRREISKDDASKIAKVVKRAQARLASDVNKPTEPRLVAVR